MASEMEVTAVTTTGLAPVVTLKTFLPESAVVAVELDDEDLYTRQKLLQRQLEFVDIQEEYIKDELKNLKREHLRAQEEVKRIQSVPLVIGQFIEMVDQNNGIVGSTTGSNYYVRILSTINRELLKPSSSVALHRHSNALVDVLPPEADSSISLLTQSEKPDVSYNVIFFLSLRIRFVILCLETLHIFASWTIRDVWSMSLMSWISAHFPLALWLISGALHKLDHWPVSPGVVFPLLAIIT